MGAAHTQPREREKAFGYVEQATKFSLGLAVPIERTSSTADNTYIFVNDNGYPVSVDQASLSQHNLENSNLVSQPTTGNNAFEELWATPAGKGNSKGPMKCTKSGHKCAFPFIYQGTTYSACTSIGNNGVPWCQVSPGEWGDCDHCSESLASMIKNNPKKAAGIGGLISLAICVSCCVKWKKKLKGYYRKARFMMKFM